MFRRTETGHLEHLHYGASLFSTQKYEEMKMSQELLEKEGLAIEKTAGAIAPKHYFCGGNMNYYSDEHENVALEMLGL